MFQINKTTFFHGVRRGQISALVNFPDRLTGAIHSDHWCDFVCWSGVPDLRESPGWGFCPLKPPLYELHWLFYYRLKVVICIVHILWIQNVFELYIIVVNWGNPPVRLCFLLIAKLQPGYQWILENLVNPVWFFMISILSLRRIGEAQQLSRPASVDDQTLHWHRVYQYHTLLLQWMRRDSSILSIFRACWSAHKRVPGWREIK